jgi:hypothetical protein
MILNLEQVNVGHEEWCKTNTRVNTRIQAERQALQIAQKPDIIDIDVDVSDIDKLFEERGQGPHLLEMEFVPATEAAVQYVSKRTDKPTTRWTWRHKIIKMVVIVSKQCCIFFSTGN